MIYMATNICGAPSRAAFAKYPDLGMLVSPRDFRQPWCPNYACDNDCYRHSNTPGWWESGGEAKWLKMLERVAAANHEAAPLFCALPDVVADWERTIERAYHYRATVERYDFKTAICLQDGCEWKDVNDFAPDAVFVGGTREWKWHNCRQIIHMFKGRYWVHVGKVNGWRAIRMVRQWGADSADGTGLARHFDEVLPQVLRGLYQDGVTKAVSSPPTP